MIFKSLYLFFQGIIFMDYILLIAGIFAVCFLLGSLLEFLTGLCWVNYWHDGNTAVVFIERTYGGRYFVPFRSESFSYTFEKNESGTWKYTKDNLNLKKRIICFLVILITIIAIYIYLDYRPFPSFWPIFKSILISFLISFTGMFTDPLEAYIVLRRDLRKKERGDLL